MDCSLPGAFVHGDSPGKNTRVGCHALPQGIFPTQASNPGLPHCRRILYHLSHQGSPWLTVSVYVHIYTWHSNICTWVWHWWYSGEHSYLPSICKVKVKVKSLSRVWLFATPSTIAYCSLPGSSVHGIFQAIVLKWIAISFFRGSSWPRDRTRVSHVVDRCFTVWATREVQVCVHVYICVFTYTLTIPWSRQRRLIIVSDALERDWKLGIWDEREI